MFCAMEFELPLDVVKLLSRCLNLQTALIDGTL
jgi:hypothetical protein